ncbi:hypothetical protein EMCRGX_G008573 [Ephydatia muelleri]
MKQWEQAHIGVMTDNGICTTISDSVNESLQQSFGEMKEVLQSKPVVESNYSTDVGKFTVQFGFHASIMPLLTDNCLPGIVANVVGERIRIYTL